MKRILIVDDEKNIRTLFRDELEEDGYIVESAGSGTEALRKIDEDKPDLVVLDIRMEDMTGLQVLEQIRNRDRTLPVIMCTAVRGLEDDFSVWDAHVSAYITKPVDLDELKDRIRAALKGSEF